MVVWSNGTKTRPRVTSKYGDPRPGGRIHEGTDFDGFTTVKAIISGVVTWVGFFNGAAGHAVVYEGVDPRTGEHVEVRHFHMSSTGIKVRKGQRISEGTALGSMGNTGNATGKCDHLEIRRGRGGPTVNSEKWIADRVNTMPPFPLPRGYYYGPRSGPKESVSGYFGNGDGLRTWQERMKARGWPIKPDGRYGDETKRVATAFQKEKGLKADGLIGPATWNAAWTAPVT